MVANLIMAWHVHVFRAWPSGPGNESGCGLYVRRWPDIFKQ